MQLVELPCHAKIDTFLRGLLERFKYNGVNDLKHAANFVRKYFNGGYQNGYNANAIKSIY